jgi:hypothetical protein
MKPAGSRRRVFAGRSELQLLVIALLCAGLLLGCAEIRKATYPKNFVYLEHKQITSEMALLSFHMRKIDEILLDGTTISSEQQSKIINILSSINASADALGAGSTETNHLVLDEHIDQFKSDVNVALRDVSADPPNYYALGKLAGSCVACHQYRKF